MGENIENWNDILKVACTAFPLINLLQMRVRAVITFIRQVISNEAKSRVIYQLVGLRKSDKWLSKDKKLGSTILNQKSFWAKKFFGQKKMDKTFFGQKKFLAKTISIKKW